MNQVVHIFPEIHDRNGNFKRFDYDWLRSDWPASRWEIRDPINPDFENPDFINFDCIVAPGETLLDYPELVEDIRKSIVIAVELDKSFHERKHTFQARSVSAITNFAYHLMRIYREIIGMGFSSPSDLDAGSVSDLLQRLALPEHISRRYAKKLEAYFDSVPLSDLPVAIHHDNRILSGVKQQVLAKAIGVTQFRTCLKSLGLIKSVNRQLQEHYAGIKFDTEILERETNPDKSSEKQVRDLYRVLRTFHRQSAYLTDFGHPLVVDPFSGTNPSDAADRVLQTVDVRVSKGSTRDIPIPVYLTLLDAAARWVLDYADELFELERQMRDNGTHKKAQNRAIRVLSAQSNHIGKVASPFPLGYYRHHQENTQGSKYSPEFLAEFQGYLEQGLSPKEVRQRLGLNKNQYLYISRIINDYYYQNVEHSGLSLNFALYGILPFCCQLLLLCFTAGRESSINDLRAGCVRRVAGLRYINLYIPKTVRDYEDLPTCALVERAVNVLERLSEEGRALWDHDKIFQFVDLKGDSKLRSFRFDDLASRFMDFIDLELDEHGNHWNLNEHQFRRAFAIMYFYRYGSDHETSFNALMHQLRHEDWTMTGKYLTQREAGATFRQIEEEWLAGILLKGRSNDPELVSLSSLSESVQKSVYQTDLVRPRQAERALEKVQEDSLTIEFLNFGAVCLGFSPGRAEKAKCAIKDGGEYLVALHKASERFCDGCPNLVQCSSLVSQKAPGRDSLTDLACDSPILDSVIASGGINGQG
ncbi:hypothetical protein [Marinobacter shengliensis]|uniref:hypothetical protein n=1 Tax=Marinobacter shengliensis TaxID=1389223 RepID=UPI0025744B46|nr:hypothetical protein [Marinobacter shengliensis]BEH13952.1 hypothetical protein MAALD49_13200 [Marinobacter shengliensis]